MKKSRIFGITVFISTLIIILAIMIGPFFRANIVRGAQQSAIKNYKNISVELNDTLWNIADEYMNSDFYDHKHFIAEVIQINNIQNERIYAGETIIIPMIEYQQ